MQIFKPSAVEECYYKENFIAFGKHFNVDRYKSIVSQAGSPSLLLVYLELACVIFRHREGDDSVISKCGENLLKSHDFFLGLLDRGVSVDISGKVLSIILFACIRSHDNFVVYTCDGRFGQSFLGLLEGAPCGLEPSAMSLPSSTYGFTVAMLFLSFLRNLTGKNCLDNPYAICCVCIVSIRSSAGARTSHSIHVHFTDVYTISPALST